MFDGHAVPLIGDARVPPIVELRDLQLRRLPDVEAGGEAGAVPLREDLVALDIGLGAVFGFVPGRSPDLERGVPVACRAERVHPGQIRGVVHVQMGQESLGHPRGGDLHHVVVDPATGTRVEHERIAVSQLHEHAVALLIRADDVAPTGTHQRDPHLVGVQLLAGIDPQVGASDDVLQLRDSVFCPSWPPRRARSTAVCL